MRTAGSTWTVARQIAFFAPTDMKGKWHAAWKISHTAVCGAAMELGTDAIRTSQGQESNKVHPFACKRCLRLSTTPGVSAIGMEQ
jgi:hypothetical protein